MEKAIICDTAKDVTRPAHIDNVVDEITETVVSKQGQIVSVGNGQLAVYTNASFSFFVTELCGI